MIQILELIDRYIKITMFKKIGKYGGLQQGLVIYIKQSNGRI